MSEVVPVMNKVNTELSNCLMERVRVVIPWGGGLHLRPATRIVRLAQGFRSCILLRIGKKVADARSILSVITLCASMGMSLEIEAAGEDAVEAVKAIEALFGPDQLDAGRPPGDSCQGPRA